MPFIPLLAGTVSKAFLKVACRSVTVEGLPAFLERLHSDRGILTVSNHLSVVDEPFMWGILPPRTFLDERTTRWTLGASDIMFTNKFTRWFFTSGQVIETKRGKGIYQPAIDRSIQKLDAGKWINIFPEGRIKQETLDDVRRFKWGVSRMLMETKRTPLIIPIWLTGFDQVMSESRTFPRPVPRFGKTLSITIGEPINDSIEPLLLNYRQQFPIDWKPTTYGNDVSEDLAAEPAGLAQIRSEIAEEIRQQVLALGERSRSS